MAEEWDADGTANEVRLQMQRRQKEVLGFDGGLRGGLGSTAREAVRKAGVCEEVSVDAGK
jgi:hypothetical protein